MATQYFRITAYHPAQDLSAIMDSNGLFGALWEFSSFLVHKGFKIIEVGTDEKFLDVNIEKAEPAGDKIILRSDAKGRPETVTHSINGITYYAVQVGDKVYIPDRNAIKGE